MSFFFNNRAGQTPVEADMIQYLIPEHINDRAELYEFELENMAEGIVSLNASKKDHLDYLLWMEAHEMLLGNVWTFAGSARDNELQNHEYNAPFDIRPNLRQLEGDLKFWLENNTFSNKEISARFHLELLTIHPFKDGNGRWARILTSHICIKEKMEIPTWGELYTDDEIRRTNYINAIKIARSEDNLKFLMNFMFS